MSKAIPLVPSVAPRSNTEFRPSRFVSVVKPVAVILLCLFAVVVGLPSGALNGKDNKAKPAATTQSETDAADAEQPVVPLY